MKSTFVAHVAVVGGMVKITVCVLVGLIKVENGLRTEVMYMYISSYIPFSKGNGR